MALTIIHCADVHLDARMEANMPADLALQRRHEILQTFLDLISYAQKKNAAAVVIAGDLFDSARVSATTLDMVLTAMANAAPVSFIYLSGNHDASGKKLFRQLPANVLCASDTWQSYRFADDQDAVVVSACEMTTENAESLYGALSLDVSETNIVALHGQIGTKSGVDLVNLGALRNKGIDYLALGHLHSQGEGDLDGRGRYAYCGCLEGRGFDECGPKGFMELTCENGYIKSTFVPFAKRTLHRISVDITNLDDVSDILAAIRAEAKGIPHEDLLKVVLKGTFVPETNKDLAFLAAALQRSYFFVKIQDKSKLRFNMAEYKYDASLRGEFARLVAASDYTDPEKECILACGLQALAEQGVR